MRVVVAIITLLAISLTAHPSRAEDRTFLTSDGIRLHYTETGPLANRGAHTLVFVPGWTMPAWIWAPQIAAFSEYYHVIAFDPRSQGDSQIARTGHEPYRRGQDIAELLDRLGPDPVVLIGWSLGVLDSLAYIHTHGDRRIAGLVLVDNSIGEDPAPVSSGRHAPARPRLSRQQQMRAFVHSMFHMPQSPEYLERLTETALRTPPFAAAALLAYPVPRTFWKEAVYSTEKPILYVVRPQLAGQAANLAAHDEEAETVVMRDVGHALFVDNAVRFNNLLTEFLRGRVWR